MHVRKVYMDLPARLVLPVQLVRQGQPRRLQVHKALKETHGIPVRKACKGLPAQRA